jgi:hypothetical protein
MFRAGTLNPYLLMERVVIIKHGADRENDGVRELRSV